MALKPSWFNHWNWLNHAEPADAGFCRLCARAENERKLKASFKDAAFIERGYTNWKDATEGFRRHEGSRCHQDAVRVIVDLPRTTHNIGESLSTAHMKKKEESRKMLLKIILNLKFLGRQGIVLCGHEEEESNFMQLFKLCELDNPILSAWLTKSGDNYLSHDIQNEILEVMSMSILRLIACQLQSSSMFSVLADKYIDVANHEQLAMCFRWVDASLNVHEEFIGLYHISDISANTIVHAIKDCLLWLNLQWCRCRRQCFDR